MKLKRSRQLEWGVGGAALALLCAVAVIASTRGSSGAEASQPVSLGEARSASLTVNLAPAVADKIYGASQAAGRPIVVIDAGHGGRDPGATSVSGEATEKDLTLELARDLRDALVKRGRVRVAMTRDGDAYMPLDDRAAVARRLGASLFLSLHMDSAPNPLARGATVYSLSDVASDAEAERLARSQNSSSGPAGPSDGSVQAVLAELATRDQMNASADLAARLVRKAAGRVELRPEPHRFAAFHVLGSSGTAAVLFEAGYLSNVDDEALLRSPEHRSAIVLALAQAVEADIAARNHR
ncbi:MAG: N-acetylmuramoyl-L-alanine amidase [Sphingomicrobium sp.]